MKLAMIGLGRMGMNMARRLLTGKHEVIAYNRTAEKTNQLVKEGAVGAYSLQEIAKKLSPPRIVWLMLPAGPLVDDHMNQLKALTRAGMGPCGGQTCQAAIRQLFVQQGAPLADVTPPVQRPLSVEVALGIFAGAFD